MRIATTYTGISEKFPIEKIIEWIAAAGFEGIDFPDMVTESEVNTSYFREHAKHLTDIAQKYGISFTQAHAPIIGRLLKEFDGDKLRASDRICRSIEFASLLGAEHVVVHPIQKPEHATDPESVFDENMEFYKKIALCAKNFGVKLAMENMIMTSLDGHYNRAGVCADPVEFKRYIDTLGKDTVGGCLDTGHSAVAGREPQHMLRAMGSEYITCTHIHDNDLVRDWHQLPGTMKMNCDEICRAMADIGYSGDFTLECVCFYNKFSEALLPEAFKFMYKTAEHLVNEIEKYKI